MVFVYKKLAQFAVRCALPPRRSESPVCATDNKPSCVLHLLGWFIVPRGFSSLERRPEFWVLYIYVQMLLPLNSSRFLSLDSSSAASPWTPAATLTYFEGDTPNRLGGDNNSSGERKAVSHARLSCEWHTCPEWRIRCNMSCLGTVGLFFQTENQHCN